MPERVCPSCGGHMVGTGPEFCDEDQAVVWCVCQECGYRERQDDKAGTYRL